MIKVLIPFQHFKFPSNAIIDVYGARETYLKKLISHNIIPVFVSDISSFEMIDQLYNECDGVLLLGGTDFDPKNYDEIINEATVIGEPKRDDLELYILKKVLIDRKPTLGICRGAQAIAIASGGKLNQHIPDFSYEPHGLSEGGTYDSLIDGYRHPVILEKNTRASNIFNMDAILINTAHHQCIVSVGESFIISGKTIGKITEIIEHKEFYCMGFQGHPEAMNDDISEKIFTSFFDSLNPQ